MNDKLNAKLSEYGIEAFVRRIVCDVLMEVSLGKIDPDDAESVINKRLNDEFCVVANAVKTKVFAELQEKMEESYVNKN